MDELKPEDELKPNLSDRRIGDSRSHHSSYRDSDSELQINFDVDVLDFEVDKPCSARTRNICEEQMNNDKRYYALDDDEKPEKTTRRRYLGKRNISLPRKSMFRQYIMLGVGILMLLLLILGIASVLKAPSVLYNEQASIIEKNIDLSANRAAIADQTNALQVSPPQQSQENALVAEEKQQGGQNNLLIQQQRQGQANSLVTSEPAIVAPPVHSDDSHRQEVMANKNELRTEATHLARKHVAIEPKLLVLPKRAKTTITETMTPVSNRQMGSIKTFQSAAVGGKESGDPGSVGSLKSAPSNHYTLQLSSSSNYDNLNNWAKKENLTSYVVYETTRNGQRWYVLVSGIYPTKEDAKSAVATLSADVKAKNPWVKPLHQVQFDLR